MTRSNRAVIPSICKSNLIVVLSKDHSDKYIIMATIRPSMEGLFIWKRQMEQRAKHLINVEVFEQYFGIQTFAGGWQSANNIC